MRKRAAIRAYFEWMPIREWKFRPNARIFRQFHFGNLADLLMLDTRNYGRDQQSAAKPMSPTVGFPANDPVANDPARTLLGFDQEEWLTERLSLSQSRGTTWRLLGQQVMMAQLSVSGGQTVFNLDQWDGYVPARQRLFDAVRGNNVDNLVVLTGDIHTSWANELTDNPWNPAGYDPATGRGVLGVEFVTPGRELAWNPESRGSGADRGVRAQRLAAHEIRRAQQARLCVIRPGPRAHPGRVLARGDGRCAEPRGDPRGRLHQ